jgi:UDP-N-acetylmuramate dehydrogenase
VSGPVREVRADLPLVAPALAPAQAAHLAAQLVVDLERVTGVRPLVAEPMADHTTLRVGGPADLLAFATNAAELAALVRFARGAGLPLLVLGRGSNVVVADAGIRGLTIVNRAEGAAVDGVRLVAESGLPLARAATLAQQAGLSGLEFGLAIPGTVGGAVWANAGAHGSDVAAVLESAALLRADGTEAVELAATLGLTYRDSRLKHPAGQGSGSPTNAAAAPGIATEVVLSATFRLCPANPAEIKAKLDEIRGWRRDHQPLSQPSAGSVFRNPPANSAGRLIDACGLKGRSAGGAQISEKHANFIVNEGGATAADIRRLADEARAEVAARFGIELEYEVQFIGEWPKSKQEVA